MRFDENFLKDMGLSAMPEDIKKKFLNYVEEEVNVRIGERISRGLSEALRQPLAALSAGKPGRPPDGRCRDH